jgi:hypothetical protein
MSRVIQPQGIRGSLKWIQRGVNTNPDMFTAAVLEKIPGAKSVSWRSPLADDGYAEYRDGEFLTQIGAQHLRERLEQFWPRLGPQWDALGVTDSGDVLLVEAKAHIDELCSPGTAAGEISRPRIEEALAKTIAALGAKPKSDWADVFYQYANRLAHLHFLLDAEVSAWLVLVNFVDDTEMNGPLDAREWEAAYRVVNHVLGINNRAPLMRRVVHVYPNVHAL